MIDLRRSAETGFGLVEVVVSSAVLMLITLGTLSLIDGSQGTSIKNRARNVAAGLAEQDQERMRSTRVLDLNNYAGTQTITVGGVPYRVESKSEWLRDASGSPVSCTSGTGEAEYMRITSTADDVSGATGVRPVTINSIVSPDVGTFGPGQGTLSVEIKDRSGAGQPGIPITVTGPQAGTVTTDANGCAVFNYYKVGAYTVSYSKPGYVNTLGVQAVSIGGQINAGTVNPTPQQLYDRPASITIAANTRKSSGGALVATNLDVPASAVKDAVTVANSGIGNATGGRLFFTGSVPLASVTAPGLFPFANGDTVYAGNCATNDPATAAVAGDPYKTMAPVALTPGASSSATVFQPWLQVKVKRGSAYYAGATVYAKEAGCGTVYKLTNPTAATTGLTEDSLPWGKYLLCATDGTREVKTAAGAVSLDKSTRETAPGDLVIPTSGATGTCANP